MKANFKICAAMFVFTAFFTVSCSKSEKKNASDEGAEILFDSTYTFYHFTDGSYREAAKVSEISAVPKKPWTEAVRISAISVAAGSDGGSVPKAYAVVNRTGIMTFEDGEISFSPDRRLFDGRTAGNLVFYEDTPVYSLYRSTFFNDLEWNRGDLHPFLVQFNDVQKISYPLINVENLGFGAETEITDYLWDGKVFTCSAKSDVDSRVNFSYWTFQPKEHLLSITPENASKNILAREVSAAEFRNVQGILPFLKAPERMRDLLSSVRSSEYLISVASAGGHSPRLFIRSKSSLEDSPPIKAYGLLSPSLCAALFQDGTFFMKGALEGERIFNGGKTVALRLPRLPEGFFYTGFAVSGRTLYASWEETDFYRTGRSGFISVRLEKIL